MIRAIVFVFLISASTSLLSVPQVLWQDKFHQLQWFSEMGSHYQLFGTSSPGEEGSSSASNSDEFLIFAGVGLGLERPINERLVLNLGYRGDFELFQPSRRWLSLDKPISDNLDAKLGGYLQKLSGKLSFSEGQFDLKLYLNFDQRFISTNQFSQGGATPRYQAKEYWKSSVKPEVSFRNDRGDTIYLSPILVKKIDFLKNYRSYQTFGNGGSAVAGYRTQLQSISLDGSLNYISYKFEDPGLDGKRRGMQGSALWQYSPKIRFGGELILFNDQFDSGHLSSGGAFFDSLERKSRLDRGSVLSFTGRYQGETLGRFAKFQWASIDSTSSENQYSSMELMLGVDFGQLSEKSRKLTDLIELDFPY